MGPLLLVEAGEKGRHLETQLHSPPKLLFLGSGWLRNSAVSLIHLPVHPEETAMAQF